MSKQYTFRDDNFIVAYLDAVGPIIGPRDLGRSEKSVLDRAKKLKACGAWDAIRRINSAKAEYVKCLGGDEFDQEMATLAR